METIRDGAGDVKLDRRIKRAYLGGERMYKIRARTDKKKVQKERMEEQNKVAVVVAVFHLAAVVSI